MPRNMSKLIGWVNGRPVYEIAGGAPEGDETGDDGDTGGDSDDAALLDDDSGDADGDDSGDEGDGSESGASTDQIVQQVTDRLSQTIGDQVQSAVDRRVNQLVKKGKTDSNSSGQKQQQQQAEQQQQLEQQQLEMQTSEGRMVFNEALTDRMKLSTEERSLARDMAGPLIQSRIRDGVAPSQAGDEVARDVSDKMRKVRSQIIQRTKTKLRQQGQLREEGEPSNSPAGTSATGQTDQQVAKGREQAQRLMASRYPQTHGKHKQQQG